MSIAKNNKKEVQITPELIYSSFVEAKKNMFIDCLEWTLAPCSEARQDVGWITLKNGRKALVSVIILDQAEVDE